MNLRDAINSIENLSDDLVLFARKNGDWRLDEPIALVISSDVHEIGTDLEGLHYFLEVETGKEVLEVWKEWRDGREPTE
jgi:hypothetical protein